MANDLSDKEKTTAVAGQGEGDRPQPAQGGALPSAATDFTSSIGAYSGLTQKDWDADTDGHALRDKWWGRLLIRGESRAILGAAAFAGGGLLAEKWLKGYHPDSKFAEQSNPLQFIAKLVDTVAGKPIKTAVTMIKGEEAALRAIHFKPTDDRLGMGRSLGHEVVGVTFDFFCASIGDAFGRDVAGWFDPHVKKAWIKDGHVSFPEAIKGALRGVSRYVTYNGGEDWAVAIPYVYFMKGQRAVLNKFSPGFMYDRDRARQGGGFKIDDHNKVTGNFVLESMLDYQGRFTAYNIGTLMYREAYDYVAHKVKGEKASLYGAADKPDEKKGVLGNMATFAKWTTRSVIKGVITMTPTVPFFSITRANQMKEGSPFIHVGVDEHGRKYSKGMLSLINHEEKSTFVRAGEEIPAGKMFYAKHDRGEFPTGTGWTIDPSVGRSHPPATFPSPISSDFKPDRHGTTPLQKTFDAVGRGNAQLRKKMRPVAGWVDSSLSNAGARKLKDSLDITNFNKLSDRYVDAAVSYTPYMYAKAEFSRLWDHGKMDMATERMIDGAASLNWGEFKAGAGEVWRSVMQKPLTDAAREAEGQRRMEMDTSPPVDVARNHDGSSNWRERMISAKRSEEGHAVRQQKSVSYAEQEAQRAALEESDPPTKSIH